MFIENDIIFYLSPDGYCNFLFYIYFDDMIVYPLFIEFHFMDFLVFFIHVLLQIKKT